jgi:hypothetical protein
LRKKEVLTCFKDVFSDFLLENGYTFYENCFICYKNEVLNRVSLFTQKNIDVVTFDIIHNCKPIYENFVSIRANNERDDFSIGTLAYVDNILDDVEWSYLYNDNADMTEKIQSAFEIYKNYFTNVHSESIDDYKGKFKAYNQKLEDSSEVDPYEFMADVFTGKHSLEGLPKDKMLEIEEILIESRGRSYYLIQYLNELIDNKTELNNDFNLNYIADHIKEINEYIYHLYALCTGNEEYLRKIKEREEIAQQEIITKNKSLLSKIGL